MYFKYYNNLRKMLSFQFFMNLSNIIYAPSNKVNNYFKKVGWRHIQPVSLIRICPRGRGCYEKPASAALAHPGELYQPPHS